MSDSISRQKAIDMLRKWDAVPDYNEAEHHIMRAAMAMLEDMPSAEPKQRWIPVTERLPEETGIYLVTLKTDGVAYFEDEFPNGFVYASAYEAVTMHWGYCDKNVIAWMPLPEPYQDEEHGQH